MVPWVHLFVSQYGTVVPCCLTDWGKDQALGDINESSVKEIWNGSNMKKFRQNMLKDKSDKRCRQCYDNEKNGLKSKRNIVNFLYADKFEWVKNTKHNGFSKDAKPIYWDLRISNLCNLKCRICGHHSSSSWYEDAKELGLLSHKTKVHHGPQNFGRLIEQLEFAIPDLEEIYFAGGEPLIMKEHYELLNYLIENNKRNIKLRYNTNFSQTDYKGQNLFKLWEEFDDVFVHASLDGSLAKGELQRSGQNWEEVEHARRRMIEICPDVDFMVTPTISVFNVLHLPDFHKYWVEEGLIDIDEFIPHILREPDYYNIQILPDQLKNRVEEKINKHIEWIKDFSNRYPPKEPNPEQIQKWASHIDLLKVENVTGFVKLDIVINEFKNCITYMNALNKTHIIPEFIKWTEKIDKLRDENTRKTFPELEELWQ